MNAAQSALVRLAFRLADESAGGIFTANSFPRGGGWYEIPPSDERDGWYNRHLRYLRARDMLTQHPKDKTHWKVRPAPR